MVFSSLSFLFIYLPILLLIYFLLPNKRNIKQYCLLIFSLIFYSLGEPRYIILIMICIFISWYLSKYISNNNKLALIIAIIINILPLIITKYLGFIINNINHLFSLNIHIPHIIMPIGISFYTFQVITYLIDLYHHKFERQNNIFLFSLYIMFFPQLIAGPIVKYNEINKDIIKPDIKLENIKYGTGRFILGLSKKVLLANEAGYIVTSILNNPLNTISTKMAWLCIIAYTIQIYFDFSGYSEMAIGLGYIFGFHFPENFNYPYMSLSISDFFRRWHITLGRFFREYIYIPLGGNRVNKLRFIFNMFIVWSLTGLWHGASWNYIIWGLYFCILIIIERNINIKLPKIINWFLTIFFIMIGWAIFISDNYSLNEMYIFIKKLFFINQDLINPITIGSLKLWGYIPFIIIGIIVSTPIWLIIKELYEKIQKKYEKLFNIINDLTLILLFILSIIFLMGGTYNPFIYFRF